MTPAKDIIVYPLLPQSKVLPPPSTPHSTVGTRYQKLTYCSKRGYAKLNVLIFDKHFFYCLLCTVKEIFEELFHNISLS